MEALAQTLYLWEGSASIADAVKPTVVGAKAVFCAPVELPLRQQYTAIRGYISKKQNVGKIPLFWHSNNVEVFKANFILLMDAKKFEVDFSKMNFDRHSAH